MGAEKKKKKTLLAVTLVIVATFSLVLGPTLGAIAHDFTYHASLSIGYDQESSRFEGRLKTGADCQGRRPVSVFESRPGSDRLVAKDKTNRKGDYAVGNPEGLTGSFYAHTRISIRGGSFHHHRCKGDRSETIEITEP